MKINGNLFYHVFCHSDIDQPIEASKLWQFQFIINWIFCASFIKVCKVKKNIVVIMYAKWNYELNVPKIASQAEHSFNCVYIQT